MGYWSCYPERVRRSGVGPQKSISGDRGGLKWCVRGCTHFFLFQLCKCSLCRTRCAGTARWRSLVRVVEARRRALDPAGVHERHSQIFFGDCVSEKQSAKRNPRTEEAVRQSLCPILSKICDGLPWMKFSTN
jgi:hypothetical protein